MLILISRGGWELNHIIMNQSLLLNIMSSCEGQMYMQRWLMFMYAVPDSELSVSDRLRRPFCAFCFRAWRGPLMVIRGSCRRQWALLWWASCCGSTKRKCLKGAQTSSKPHTASKEHNITTHHHRLTAFWSASVLVHVWTVLALAIPTVCPHTLIKSWLRK